MVDHTASTATVEFKSTINEPWDNEAFGLS